MKTLETNEIDAVGGGTVIFVIPPAVLRAALEAAKAVAEALSSDETCQ